MAAVDGKPGNPPSGCLFNHPLRRASAEGWLHNNSTSGSQSTLPHGIGDTHTLAPHA